MQEPLSNLRSQTKRLLGIPELRDWLHAQFLEKKLNSLFGLILLGAIALGFGVVIGQQGLAAGAFLLTVIVGIPLILASLFDLRFGVLLVLVAGFWVLEFKRFNPDIPIGLLMDVLVIVMFLGLFIKQIRTRDWRFIKSPVSVMVMIWIFYNILEGVNPIAASRLAWLYTIRSMAGIMLLYFVALYAIDNIRIVNRIFIILISLSLVVALYTFWQEFFGFSQAEWRIIQEDRELFGLLFQAGKFRKFSILDPVTLGIVMAYAGMVCFILMMGPFSPPVRLFFGFLGGLMIWAMLYSGTRTAYVLLPAGMFFYALLTLNRGALLGLGFGMVLGLGILFAPTMNVDHHRFKTAFSVFTSPGGNFDPSFAVRVENQEKMQPWIRSHPIGGGLGSVGAWGKRFSPGTFLANFPPDSGYVRIAVEQGWLGLLLYLSLLFVIMRTGIRNYFQVRDPLIKTYYVALLTLLFMLLLGNYPQEAITQLPTSVIFILATALMVNLKKLDTA